MKTKIKALDNSGFAHYDVTFATNYSGVRNVNFYACAVFTKETFSKKVFKKWATQRRFDVDALFTNIDVLEQDMKIVKKLIKAFKKDFIKCNKVPNSHLVEVVSFVRTAPKDLNLWEKLETMQKNLNK